MIVDKTEALNSFYRSRKKLEEAESIHELCFKSVNEMIIRALLFRGYKQEQRLFTALQFCVFHWLIKNFDHVGNEQELLDAAIDLFANHLEEVMATYDKAELHILREMDRGPS